MARHRSLLGGLLLAACILGLGCNVALTPDPSAVDPGNNLQQIGVGAADGSVRNISPVADGTSNTIQVGETPARGGLSPDDLKAVTQALGDKNFEFGDATSNSDRNAFLTGTTDLALCAFGRFGRIHTLIFSSEVGDSTTEDRSGGTWRIVDVQGSPVLELHVENSTERNFKTIEQLTLTTDASGNLLINRQRATISDAAGDCAAAQGNQ
jgi:hypothetical protein